MKVFILVFSLLSASAFAHDMPSPVIAKDFEAMKALLGTWEGKAKMGGKDVATNVSYKLTSGGTAIIETLAEGTPHEMVLGLFDSRQQSGHDPLLCGRQSARMALKKTDGKTFAFEMNGTKGIENPKDMHMHAVTLTMADKNHLKQEWTNYADNKKGEVAVFEFTRKQ